VDIDATPEKLAEDLSCKSVEIENIEKFGGDFLETVVVGEIKEINQHPNADKLKIVMVDVGNARSLISRPSTERKLEDGNTGTLQIVCGAPNIEVGQKVPVALVGTKLPVGEIKDTKIRDVESFGMLCAEDELLLGNDHAGILILDPSLKVGTKLSETYNDFVLDGKPGANRGDLLNHVGLAREVAAIYSKVIKEGNLGRKFGKEILGNSDSVEVEIENLEACPLYTARLIRGVKIGPSPIWMQQALLACGMRPINNIVDVTNYVMLEYGNPLHAFDAKKIPEVGEKHKIVIRLTKKGEIIRTLDGKDYEVPEGLLVIADHEKPVAVAGVMGGENSEIDESTTDIIIESATFSRKYIRKSQTELGITTEASSRFAKGLSRELALMCLDRATRLFEEVCGGQAVEVPIIAGNLPEEKKPIEVDFEKINTFLSIDIKKDEAIKILGNLGFTVEDNKVIAPMWREDVFIWQDVAEEIGRIYGLDKVKEEELSLKIKSNTEKSIYLVESVKKFLINLELTEVFTMSILSSELIEKTKIVEHYFEIENPLNEFDRVMRSGLWNGLLLHASENAKKFDHFSLFDLSSVYLQCEKENIPSNEEKHLGILVYGEKPDKGLFVLKNYLDQFAKNFGLEFTYENNPGEQFCHPGRSAQVFYKKEKIGRICEIHPIVLEKLDLKNRVWITEVNLEKLVNNAKNIEQRFNEIQSDVVFQEFSRFEVSKRDMAVVVDEKINPKEITLAIKAIDDKIIGTELFDEFKSEKFGTNKKSLAFHLVFQATDHTLTDQESDELFNKVLEGLNNKFKVELRK